MNSTLNFIFALAACLGFVREASALQYRVQREQGAAHLIVYGEMGEIAENANSERDNELIRLEAHIARVLAEKRPVMIVFTSTGGSRDWAMDYALRIKKWSDDYFTQFGIPLVFLVDGECTSSCTFLTAALSGIHSPTHLMFLTTETTDFYFHGPTAFKTGAALAPELRKQVLAAAMADYVKYGVSPTWLSANAKLFESSELKAVNARAICNSNSGIVPKTSLIRDWNEALLRMKQIKKAYKESRAFLEELKKQPV